MQKHELILQMGELNLQNDEFDLLKVLYAFLLNFLGRLFKTIRGPPGPMNLYNMKSNPRGQLLLYVEVGVLC